MTCFGSCNEDSGACECAAGAWGAACEETCDCGFGATTCAQADGACECIDGWSGALCDSCDAAVVCTGHGACDSGVGVCTCEMNWYGADCATECTDTATCSGHGFCSETGACDCGAAWSGADCTVGPDAGVEAACPACTDGALCVEVGAGRRLCSVEPSLATPRRCGTVKLEGGRKSASDTICERSSADVYCRHF